jgi:hypothetical protein
VADVGEVVEEEDGGGAGSTAEETGAGIESLEEDGEDVVCAYRSFVLISSVPQKKRKELKKKGRTHSSTAQSSLLPPQRQLHQPPNSY